MLRYYTWRRFLVVKIRTIKIREMHPYVTLGLLGFKVVKKWMMNLFKGSEDFGFWIFSIIILIETSLEKNLKNFCFSLHHRLILFLTVSFKTKLMEYPWVPLYLLSLLTCSWVFTKLSAMMNIISTKLNFV